MGENQNGGKRYFLFQIGFFAATVAINFILPRTAGALGLPLYLDNVGTLLAAVLGGYLPGIFVGYLNNIINMQGNPGNAYYVVLSTMIAACGTYLGRKGWFDRFGKALLTIPLFAFIGGCLGSILTYLLYGYGMGEGISAPFARALLEKGTLSVFWALSGEPSLAFRQVPGLWAGTGPRGGDSRLSKQRASSFLHRLCVQHPGGAQAGLWAIK